jgi:MFS family permease
MVRGAAASTTAPRTAVRRLALGRFISHAGSLAANTALAFSMYERTDSAGWIAATFAATWGIEGLLSPIAGAIGDRFDRRRVMIVSEIAEMACWIAMVFLDAPVALLGVAFLASVLGSPFYPASTAAIPNVAGEEHLSWANSLIAVGSNTGLTLGPILGGVLFAAVGARWVFAANAVSFALSVLLVWSIHADFSDPDRSEESEAEHRGFVAGFRFINRDRVLRTVIVSFIAFIIGMGTTLVADPVLADEFGVGSLGFGLLTACWGVGTIVGALLGRWVTEENEGRVFVVFSGIVSLTGFGVALSPWFWLVLVWIAMFGLADGPTVVAEQNLLQRRTPDAVRSRVLGAWEALNHGALVVSLALGGLIVPWLGPQGAYAFGGVTGLVGTLVLLPLLRWLPERAAADPAPAGSEAEAAAVSEGSR